MHSKAAVRHRQSNLDSDIKQAKIGATLLIVPLLLFLFNDFQFFGLSIEFFTLVSLRLCFLTFTAWLLLYLKRVSNFQQYDQAVFLWGLAGVIITNLINASRPNNFLLHIIIVIAKIVIIYLVIPQRVLSKVFLSLVATIGETLILLLITKTLETPEAFSLALSLVLANVIGFSTSQQLESYRFRTFKAREKIADLARLVSENPNPVLRASQDGTILYANPAATRSFGEKVGNSLPSYIPLNCNIQREFEVTHGERTFIFIAAPIAEKGYVNLYGLDITERNQAMEKLILHERQLQALLELNKMLDASDKEIISFTLAAINKVTSSEFSLIGIMNEDETITVYSSAQVLMGQSEMAFAPVKDNTSKEDVWAKPMRQRKSVFINDPTGIPNMSRYLGSHLKIKRSLTVPIFEKERIVAIAAISNKAEDYNELDERSVKMILTDMWQLIQRRATEEKLKASAHRIEIMNEKLRVSGSLTRHDVRNKLSVIKGLSFLIKKKYGNDAAVADAANTMEKAVADSIRLFEFASLYEQLGVEELNYIDVGRAVDEAVALFSSLSFKIVNNCRRLHLLADSFLRQFFYNLLDNTQKYGKKATAVRIFYEQSGADHLQLIYEDDGEGISEEHKHKLYTEGFSTSGSTGFGLFLIKKMMDIYGWSIQEVGEPGKGVRFVVTIPKINQNGRKNWRILEG